MSSYFPILKKAFLVKPMAIAISESNESEKKLERTLNLFDLLCIGVGGTVGSGIFVLTGLIAHEYTGPGVIFSWLFAGIACSASALSYAELSCLIPSSGSSYAYVYLGLGELPAFITSFCLTLEYGMSGAAVASSWGVKVNNLISSWNSSSSSSSHSSQYNGISIHGMELNLYGGLLQFLVMLLLLRGVEISKNVINFFTVLKLLLILFIICAGFGLYKPSNISNWTPYGWNGVFHGAASCFFGYLGYDEICCLAGEAKNPQKNLPRAVIGTILSITIIYIIAAVVLIGMQPYNLIDSNNGFSMAFEWNDWIWAQQIVAIGEVITLPLVVAVSFLAQPRLQYALAIDGLIPSLFKEIDSKGNLLKGILVSGTLCTIISILIPFRYLDDMISAGVLVSFNLTNVSLIILRYKRCNSINSNHSSNNNNSNNSSSTKNSRSILLDDCIDHDDSSRYSIQSNILSDSDIAYTDIDTDGIELLQHVNIHGSSNSNSNSSSEIFDNNHDRNIPNQSTNSNNIHSRRIKSIRSRSWSYSSSGLISLSIHLIVFNILTIILCILVVLIDYTKPVHIASVFFIALISTILTFQSISIRRLLYPIVDTDADRMSISEVQSESIYRMVLSFLGTIIPIQSYLYHQMNTSTSSRISNISQSTHPMLSNTILSNNLSHPTCINRNTTIISNEQDNNSNNNNDLEDDIMEPNGILFEVPWLPFIPLCGLIINYYLIVQLSWFGLATVAIAIILSIIIYFRYSIHYSIGNTRGWSSQSSSEKLSNDEDIPDIEESTFNKNRANSNSDNSRDSGNNGSDQTSISNHFHEMDKIELDLQVEEDINKEHRYRYRHIPLS